MNEEWNPDRVMSHLNFQNQRFSAQVSLSSVIFVQKGNFLCRRAGSQLDGYLLFCFVTLCLPLGDGAVA